MANTLSNKALISDNKFTRQKRNAVTSFFLFWLVLLNISCAFLPKNLHYLTCIDSITVLQCESNFVMLSDQGFLTNIGTQLTMKRVLQTTSLGMVVRLLPPPSSTFLHGRLLQENGGWIRIPAKISISFGMETPRSSAASRTNRSESKLIKNIWTTIVNNMLQTGNSCSVVSTCCTSCAKHLEISLFSNACTFPLVSKLY